MSVRSSYTTILFDAGDTLTYQVFLQIPLIGKQLSDFLSYHAYPAMYLKEQSGGDVRVNAPKPRYWSTFLTFLRWWMRPFPDSAEVLRELRTRGWRLAVLSNAPWWGKEILRQTGLAGYFDDIIISAEMGVEKPNRAIYNYAVERLGITAPEAIFVDDNLPNVQTARDLGMWGLWLNRFARRDDDTMADIRDLRELLTMLGNAPNCVKLERGV